MSIQDISHYIQKCNFYFLFLQQKNVNYNFPSSILTTHPTIKFNYPFSLILIPNQVNLIHFIFKDFLCQFLNFLSFIHMFDFIQLTIKIMNLNLLYLFLIVLFGIIFRKLSYNNLIVY